VDESLIHEKSKHLASQNSDRLKPKIMAEMQPGYPLQGTPVNPNPQARHIDAPRQLLPVTLTSSAATQGYL